MRNQLDSLGVQVTALGWLVAALGLIAPAQGQGTIQFQNLDFELAIATSSQQPGTMISTALAIPGWSAWVDSVPQSQIGYNLWPPGAPNISLFTPSWCPSCLVQGKYAINLQAGWRGTNVSISQRGTIPADARSMRLFGFTHSPQIHTVGAIQVALSGTALDLYRVGASITEQVWGADVSAFAGQTVELTLTAPAPNPQFTYLDQIQFSDVAIPEPGPLALLVIGAAGLGMRAWGHGRASRSEPAGRPPC